jgi:hypothetical protein
MAFLFTIIIAAPIVALFSNHEVFFAVMAFCITILSFRYFYMLFAGESLRSAESDEELEEELEELIDIDVKRLGTGLSVASNLLAILFFVYCAFYLDTLVLKALASFAIILQIYFILKKAARIELPFNPDKLKPQIILSSVLNVAVVIFTLLNKLYKLQ